MASNTAAGATPAHVARMATQPGPGSSGDLLLLGIFGAQDRMQALVRERGRVRRVSPGTRIGAGRVMGIDAAGLVIQKNGRAQRVALPSG